jgi:hypothetical protein
MQTLGSRSVLELGGLITLVTFGLAALLGAIAVLDADHVASGFGIGFGVAVVVFVAGATVVCALACIARGKAELVALASVAVTGVALDLLVLAIWRDIDGETYGKVVGIALVWSFFALLAFGLMLAVSAPGRLARWPFFGALGSIAAAALIAAYLIATAGGTSVGVDVTTTVGAIPVSSSDDELVRVLGLAFVLIATLWFGAIAAYRYEQAPRSGG